MLDFAILIVRSDNATVDCAVVGGTTTEGGTRDACQGLQRGGGARGRAHPGGGVRRRAEATTATRGAGPGAHQRTGCDPERIGDACGQPAGGARRCLAPGSDRLRRAGPVPGAGGRPRTCAVAVRCSPVGLHRVLGQRGLARVGNVALPAADHRHDVLVCGLRGPHHVHVVERDRQRHALRGGLDEQPDGQRWGRGGAAPPKKAAARRWLS